MPVQEEREEFETGGSAKKMMCDEMIENENDDGGVTEGAAAARVVCEGYLAAAGLEGESPAEVAQLLGDWEDGQASFTSGIVAELMTRFRCPETLWSLRDRP